MAIFHQLVSVITKGTHTCTIATAAYRSGSLLTIKNKDGSGYSFDYSKKPGIAFSKIIAEKNLPEWVLNRQKLWQFVEDQNHDNNPNMAIEFTMSLPEELNLSQHIKLTEDLVKNSFTKRSLIADVNIHNDNANNPHVHIVCPLKNLDGEEILLHNEKPTDSSFIEKIRKEQADIINKNLDENGHKNFISHLPEKNERFSEMRPWL